VSSPLLQAPTPRESYPKQNLFVFRRDPLAFFLSLAKLGKLVRFRLLENEDWYLVNDPELIQRVFTADHRHFVKGRTMSETKRILGEGLLTSEGDLHHRQRRLIQPAFSHRKVEGYADAMVDVIESVERSWNPGEQRDIHREMYALTLRIIGDALFSTDVGDRAHAVNDALNNAIEMVGRLSLPYSNLWEHLPIPPLRRFKANIRFLNETMRELVEDRRARGEAPEDALSLLFDAQADGVADLTDKQIREEAMTMFLAGHETTASTLSWIWYLLSEHPDVEAQLHQELDRVLDGRRPTLADLPQLTVTEAIVAETVRLYPPVWNIGRVVITEDYSLGGYPIRFNSVLSLSPWVTHHDPACYPDPFRFDPSRWTPEERAKRPRYAYFPFGGGPRMCLGEGFSWLEARLSLAHIAQRWRLRHVASHRAEPVPYLTLRPRYGMQMTLERR
jgi:cytochrome P450